MGDEHNPNIFNWAEYNERLVRRGEILFKSDFIKGMDNEWKRRNNEKKGEKYPSMQIGCLFFS